jgi:hypothetical protein
LAVIVFLGGILFSLILNYFTPARLRHSSLTIAMFIEVLLFLSTSFFLSNRANGELFIVSMCLALGIQNGALHKANGVSVHSTYMTGMVTALMQKSFDLLSAKRSPKEDWSRDSAEAAAAEIAKLTGLSFVSAPNKFTVQGAHDALVQLSGVLRSLAVSLYKIGNDIRLMSCGPRAGFAELIIPENEPGSSIMPGKVNPTQAEALTMIAVQVMANDVAVGFGGASGYLEMNVYKPLIIFNITHSITILTDGCTNFNKFLVADAKPNLKKIEEYVDRSLMLVTALAPVIGYDKASKIAHYAMDNDLTLKVAALKLGFVTEAEFDRVVDPAKMVTPYVATAQRR